MTLIDRLILALPSVDGLPADDAATQLSTPLPREPRAGRVTLVTLASVWGLAKTVAFEGALHAMSQHAEPAVAAQGRTMLRILSGDGLVASDPEAQAAAESLVAAGLVSQADADVAMLSDLAYPLGSIVTAEQVAGARAERSRRKALESERGVLMGYVNDVLNPAIADPAAAVPTLDAYRAGLAAADLPGGG